jgi:hypothetical protein
MSYRHRLLVAQQTASSDLQQAAVRSRPVVADRGDESAAYDLAGLLAARGDVEAPAPPRWDITPAAPSDHSNYSRSSNPTWLNLVRTFGTPDAHEDVL